MRIRALFDADVPAAVALASANGWVTRESDWRTHFSLGHALGVEREDGVIVATAILEGGARGSGEAWVAMMLVHPNEHRRGLGRKLLEALLAERDAGATVCLYATAMGRPLYERVGFVPVARSVRVEGRFNVVATAVDGGAVVRAMEDTDVARVVALDTDAREAGRGRLLEVLRAESREAVVVERDDELAGFGFARVVEGVRTLAPIVARDDGAAVAIAAHLGRGSTEPVRIDLAPGESALRALADASGFTVASESQFMKRGTRPLGGQRHFVRALASRAYG